MAKLWVNNKQLKSDLAKYFTDNRTEVLSFGNTVNQTFEAFVFASLTNWYRQNGWTVNFENADPETKLVKLKFSTRGRPDNYTYARCTKDGRTIQIRHGLRVATKHHRENQLQKANVVLDVAVVNDIDLSKYKSNDHASHTSLITFGEAKHMSAFAELVANFIGLVHEMAPKRLENIRPQGVSPVSCEHPAPFLLRKWYSLPNSTRHLRNHTIPWLRPGYIRSRVGIGIRGEAASDASKQMSVG